MEYQNSLGRLLYPVLLHRNGVKRLWYPGTRDTENMVLGDGQIPPREQDKVFSLPLLSSRGMLVLEDVCSTSVVSY